MQNTRKLPTPNKLNVVYQSATAFRKDLAEYSAIQGKPVKDFQRSDWSVVGTLLLTMSELHDLLMYPNQFIGWPAKVEFGWSLLPIGVTRYSPATQMEVLGGTSRHRH